MSEDMHFANLHGTYPIGKNNEIVAKLAGFSLRADIYYFESVVGCILDNGSEVLFVP